MTKVTRNLGDLGDLLNEQISYLLNSCKLFDQGQTSESKRIATTIRVLVHDTKNSTSLLTQIGIKNSLLFLDSSLGSPFNGNPLSYEGLAFLNTNNIQTKFVPLLDDNEDNIKYHYFEKWWNRTIIRSEKSGIFSRKDIVLYLVNKDGGAHVDEQIAERFHKLQKLESTGWMSISGSKWKPIFGIELVSTRQIGHEILRTLKPSYRCSSLQNIGAVFGGVRLQMDRQEKINEEDLCPCGSDKKFKDCCM